MLRLKAAQPSTKECKEVAAQVSYWMSRLAVIHRQQQEVQDDMLQVRLQQYICKLLHTPCLCHLCQLVSTSYCSMPADTEAHMSSLAGQLLSLQGP